MREKAEKPLNCSTKSESEHTRPSKLVLALKSTTRLIEEMKDKEDYRINFFQLNLDNIIAIGK